MEKDSINKCVEIDPELLRSFAKFLVPEIRSFYQSDEGRTYYERWIAVHPECA